MKLIASESNEPEDFRLYYENQDVTKIALECEVPDKPMIVDYGKVKLAVFTHGKTYRFDKEGSEFESVILRVNDKNGEDVLSEVTIELQGLVHWSHGESGFADYDKHGNISNSDGVPEQYHKFWDDEHSI